jgi:glycosyltransferase involved in cell wall biosynthesis
MRSNLLLYTPYAWEAFTARYSHSPKRVLFQFHPHPDLERRILAEDQVKYPIFHYSYEEEAGDQISQEIRRRNRDVWQHADLILCASTFTRNSMLEAGAKADLCRIIPYGIDLPDTSYEIASEKSFQAVFVGSGTQRKGIHHLLLAWQKANLPADSLLTLVCRTIDPGAEALALQTPRIRLVRGLNADELNMLFRTSSLFVMPSLVEGFGQVYLEALAQGCPVLGTANTGLPDLEGSDDVVFQVEPGRLDDLVTQLEGLACSLPGNLTVRLRARTCAAKWSWERFRTGICETLDPIGTRWGASTGITDEV